MSRRTQFIKSIKPLAWGAALSAAVAGAASAQQRQLFSWNGRVDQEVQLTITGRSVTTANIGPSEPGSRGARLVSALPRTDGLVSVSLLDGRGTADVIQQPSAQNG